MPLTIRIRRPLAALTVVVPLLTGTAAHASGREADRLTPLWTARFNGVQNQADVGSALAVNPAGTTVFVAGGTGSPEFHEDLRIDAYRAGTGRPLWGERYSGPGSRDDAATALAMSPDGRTVYVTGFTTMLSGKTAFVTIAYDATTGQADWIAKYDPFRLGSSAAAIAVSPDGTRVYVTGTTDAEGPQNFATVAYDAATGAQVWAAIADCCDSVDAKAMALSPDGTRIAVTGTGLAADYETDVYDAATGSLLWIATYNGPSNSLDIAAGVRVSSTGKVYVTGSSFGVGTSQDYATVAYDLATGTQLWVSRYDDAAHGNDAATALDLSPDESRLFVTGSSATVDYDASTGTQLWAAASEGVFTSNAMRVTPDGTRVYVTGTGGFPNSNYLTVGYLTSTGAQVWSSSYDGTAGGDDESFAIGLSPTGQLVFVTGESQGVGSDYDMVTVAYRP